MKTFEDSAIRLFAAFLIAAFQNGVAVYAVFSSGQNRLSDGACLGGGFGTLANLIILAVVVIWSICLLVKSHKQTAWHPGLKPLSIVAFSSVLAIAVGMNAVLGCTI